MENEKTMTLEEGFEKLDLLTKKMEQSEISLEERFELYKQGVDLVKFCTGKIDTVEKELQIVKEMQPSDEMDENYGL